MKNTWFIADTHFSHANIIRYTKRPFADVEAHDQMLIDNWNRHVASEDDVYFLGDFAFKFRDRAKEIRRQLHGAQIFFIEGKQQIVDLSKTTNIFTGKPNLQVTRGFPTSELIVVNDVASASKAIDTIVEQGEGTSRSPLDAQDELAHYYRYAEIFHGKSLIPDPKEALGYAYAGELIPFDPKGVFPVVDNPNSATYSAGSAAANANRTFNYTYTNLLKALHVMFNGEAGRFAAAIGLMESLKQQAVSMMSTIPAFGGLNAGPSFEYNAASA